MRTSTIVLLLGVSVAMATAFPSIPSVNSPVVEGYWRYFWGWFTSWAWNDFAILFWWPVWTVMSPFIGAYAKNEVEVVYLENEALLSFLGYDRYDIYLMGLNQQKM